MAAARRISGKWDAGYGAWYTARWPVSVRLGWLVGLRISPAPRRRQDGEQGRAVPVSDTFRRGLNRVAEPAVLFPAIAILLLTATWATTFGIIRLKFSDAEHVASESSRELLE